eukprot:TRINITY_DN15058_c0_g1_i1.p1 TRINITY_DN15058_c0_g1~~TRINITY_DN15058_c0_g1_i1.p1  ORF type:complete len:239 (+),score=52.84 TRINITY_DN15058_c0_g1_i1:54-770(+)
MEQADYEELARSSFKKMYKLKNEKNQWSLYTKHNNINIYSRPISNSSIKAFFGKKTSNCNPSKINNKLWNLKDVKEINTYDTTVIQYDTLKYFTDDLRVDYVVAKLPWPLWNRDVLYILCRCVINGDEPSNNLIDEDIKKELPNGIYIWGISIDSFPSLKQPKKTTRMDVFAYLFIKGENGKLIQNSKKATIERFCFGDPNGNIPVMIINSQAKANVSGIINFLDKSCASKSKLRSRL